LCSLNDQVAFHLCHSSLHRHRKLAGGQRQIEPAELGHNDLSTTIGQRFDRFKHVRRISTKPIHLRHTSA